MKDALDFQIPKCIHPSFSIAYLRVLVLPNGDHDITRADLLSLKIQSYLQLSYYDGGFVTECASLSLEAKKPNPKWGQEWESLYTPAGTVGDGV